ncbi:MAG: type II toxin-antitoxin system RelE/ParE family toxin [Ruminococcus sp.]|nr:type II toxin-antitoxin system RelE/ParE family toxin [Ruminococcus sp.]
MTRYQVRITTDAALDLLEIRDYIADYLKEPQTALQYIRSLRQRMEHLGDFPQSIAPVEEEPWHSYGIRRLLHKNFYIYYRIDEEDRRVYVLNVIYARRDQTGALAKYE